MVERGSHKPVAVGSNPAVATRSQSFIVGEGIGDGIGVIVGIGDGVGHGFSGSPGDGHGVGETVGDGVGVCVGAALESELPAIDEPIAPTIKNAKQKAARKYCLIICPPRNKTRVGKLRCERFPQLCSPILGTKGSPEGTVQYASTAFSQIFEDQTFFLGR